MGLHRSSALLWLGAAAALITYFSNAPWPGDWNYNQWLQFGSFCVAWGIGKLQSSPLPGKHDV